MSRTIHRDLVRKFRALTPEQTTEVAAYISRLRAGLPVREEPGLREASANEEVRDVGEPHVADACADSDDAGDGARPAFDRRRASNDAATETCSFWGRRPLHAVQDEQFGPIAALLREALDERDARRQRFG